jgi:hypothetical protein
MKSLLNEANTAFIAVTDTFTALNDPINELIDPFASLNESFNSVNNSFASLNEPFNSVNEASIVNQFEIRCLGRQITFHSK